MAADVGTTNPSVGRVIAERTAHFTFLQAMWLLQRAQPKTVPIGGQGPPDEEPVRLRPSASLAFPPGDIESLEATAHGRPPYVLSTTFLGLYGAHSPLPSFYAEEILHRLDEEDPVRAFFDLFNHRLLSLFYRGLIRYRGELLYQPQGTDEYSWRLFALAGFGSGDLLASASGLPAERLLRFTGLLCHRPSSAAAMQAIAVTYFDGLPVRVEQCVRRWVYLPASATCRLGRQSTRLGDDATIGERILDRMGKFRVSIGPVDWDIYQGFLPGSSRLHEMSRLARLASGGWLAYDVEVVLRSEETPRLGIKLSSAGKLGWTTGLFSRPAPDLPVVFADYASAA